MTAAGLRDEVPADFTNAIENGTDPSPAAIAATRQLLLDKQVRALLYNPQTEDKVSREMRATAEASGIPVVEVSETLPDGLDYIQWQTRTAEALASALDTRILTTRSRTRTPVNSSTPDRAHAVELRGARLAFGDRVLWDDLDLDASSRASSSPSSDRTGRARPRC